MQTIAECLGNRARFIACLTFMSAILEVFIRTTHFFLHNEALAIGQVYWRRLQMAFTSELAYKGLATTAAAVLPY